MPYANGKYYFVYLMRVSTFTCLHTYNHRGIKTVPAFPIGLRAPGPPT